MATTMPAREQSPSSAVLTVAAKVPNRNSSLAAHRRTQSLPLRAGMIPLPIPDRKSSSRGRPNAIGTKQQQQQQQQQNPLLQQYQRQRGEQQQIDRVPQKRVIRVAISINLNCVSNTEDLHVLSSDTFAIEVRFLSIVL